MATIYTIYIDNRPYPVDPNENLLQQCLKLGFNLPYFCWHPALGSVGACRQCAVKQFKDEHDTKGKIIMACMTPASDGTRISIDDPEAKAFRANVIEWLMLNHPHDCPVCDEGGECHLQDMTVMAGHSYRRTRFPKRTYTNQYLGPFINHEMNRCIQCYRCVRYYKDYAGGHDFGVFAAHDNVYFGRSEPGVLENEFSGNLVEVCPTGVFTDKTLQQHYTRKWDLEFAPSVCVHCSLGCNTSPGMRYGTLRRIVNRYNGDVNGYFLCDRGRFGYEFVNSEKRIAHSSLRGKKEEKAENAEILSALGPMLSRSARLIGIGSPRASLEANYALRALVGADNFFAGIPKSEASCLGAILKILRKTPVPLASLREAGLADAVLVLGEDVTNVAPMLALQLRQAVRQRPLRMADTANIPRWNDAAVRELLQDSRGPLIIATPEATPLDEVATAVFRLPPENIARFGFAVASALNAKVPGPSEMEDRDAQTAQQVSKLLATAERPLVVAGTSLKSPDILRAAANVASALAQGPAAANARLTFTFEECNTFGLALMQPRSLHEAFEAAQREQPDAVLVLENDLYRRAPAPAVDAFFQRARHVIAIDSITTRTTQRADTVLACGTFAESEGTLVNNEGRAQRFFRVFEPTDGPQESWRWLRNIGAAGGRLPEEGWETLDNILASLADDLPQFRAVPDAAPGAAFRENGQKIPREPHRFSGRTAMLANVTVHEPAPPPDPDSPLSFSMEGFSGKPPSSLIPFFWAPGWNSIQSVNKFQAEIAGPLQGGNPGIRLIEPEEQPSVHYFEEVPLSFQPRPGEYLVIPAYRIFGSEELSALAPAIAARAPKPSLTLSAADAAQLGISPGNEVELSIDGENRKLPAIVSASLARGIVSLVMVEATSGATLPAWGRVRKA